VAVLALAEFSASTSVLTGEEIAKEMRLDLSKVEWMMRASQRPLHLERPVGENGDAEFGQLI
jgi:RNA polymerase primary sigma factor